MSKNIVTNLEYGRELDLLKKALGEENDTEARTIINRIMDMDNRFVANCLIEKAEKLIDQVTVSME